ncbi:radical SAM protein [Hungatella hathewayi]|uniref:radical SAM protein n=1 Tax=Hungatella hathewayi TaxID=154046 RepID=UPI003567CE93
MFNIEEFYRLAETGSGIDLESLLAYLKSFRTIILWGAGNLGNAVGKKLKELGITITCYWDERWNLLKTCNGAAVRKIFENEDQKENTLIISCIVNGSLGKEWTRNVIVNQGGYHNFLYGMILYEALICPMRNGGQFDIRSCTTSKACSLCNCELYTNLLSGARGVAREEELVFQLITFIISTRCTLKCKYCGQRLNDYAPEDRKDFPLEQIKRDMDQFFSAVDFVGMVSVIGGEPLMHNQLKEIVSHCLTKKNFGVLNVTTNGIGALPEDLLEVLKNERVKVSISRYDRFLNDRQISRIEENIKLLTQARIVYSVSDPIWNRPGKIQLQNYPDGELSGLKDHCKVTHMCAAVREGVFIPCSIIENMAGLHLYDYRSDCVILSQVEDLRKSLIENLRKPYYEACRYCPRSGTEEIPAGEQA